jgi:hypothetical protein
VSAAALRELCDMLAWEKVAYAAPDRLFAPAVVRGVHGLPFNVNPLIGLALPAMLDRAARAARGEAAGSFIEDRLETLHGGGAAALPALLRGPVRRALAQPRPPPTDAAWHSRAAALYAALPLFGASLPSAYTSLEPSGWRWLGDDVAAEALRRLQAAVPSCMAAHFEVTFAHGAIGHELVGAVDLLSDAALVELKALAGPLRVAHKLQLACYASLFLRSARAPAAGAADFFACLPAFLLYNLLSGECWRLRVDAAVDVARVHMAADRLVAARLASRLSDVGDDEFLARARGEAGAAAGAPAVAGAVRPRDGDAARAETPERAAARSAQAGRQ